MALPYGLSDRCVQVFAVAAFVTWLFGIGWFNSVVLIGLAVGVTAGLTFLQVEPRGKAVLVTGCDSGFGHAVSLQLHSLGFTVFAGCLFADKQKGGELARAGNGSGRLHVVQLDVTDQQQVDAAVETIRSLLPSGTGLWGVINNAGWSTFGNVEWMTLETYEKIAQTNLFGVIRVTKAVLPLIRKTGGRVVNIASQLGRMGAIGRSAYCLTKYGVEAFSDCLRLEMKRFGVDVVLIEPGNFIAGTSLYGGDVVQRQTKALWDNMNDEVRSAYGEDYFNSRIGVMKNFAGTGSTDISAVLDTMTDAVIRTYPRSRYLPMDAKERIKYFIANYLPEIFYDTYYGI